MVNVNTKVVFTSTKTTLMFIQSFIGMAIIDQSQQPHISIQNNKNIITSHFDIFPHILFIFKLHNSCVHE